MKKPVIELKKVKTFRGMEGTGLEADVYVDGIKTCKVLDDSTGGDIKYEVYDKKAFEAFKAYAASLPPIVSKLGGKRHEMPVVIDFLIDEVFNEMMAKKEEEKLQKRFEKMYQNQIVYGVKGSDSYRFLKFAVPLAKIPLHILQQRVDYCKAKMGKGETFFNTNFEQLGIKI